MTGTTSGRTRRRTVADLPASVTPSPAGTAPSEGVLVVDKPADWTSHDVVARVRRLAGSRRVGHAGTLDPMATGVLVVGIGRATRLLGHISGADKDYDATIRLGWSTVTDDAEGDRLTTDVGADRTTGARSADELSAGAIEAAVASLTGEIMQRPASVSAIKVDGRRSHARVRSGEHVDLPSRPVVVSRFDVRDVSRVPERGCTDLTVSVTCSSGTYVRALARDLGEALGVGGHLTALRRTRVGAFDLADARTLDQLAEDLSVLDLATAARRAFAPLRVTAADANAVRHGRAIQLGLTGSAPSTSQMPDPHSVVATPRTYGLFASDGEFLALARSTPQGDAQYLAVFSQP